MKILEKDSLCSLMRRALEKNFSLYLPTHTVAAGNLRYGGMWMVYSSKGLDGFMEDITRLDLNFEEDVCYIPSLEIESIYRRKGNGKKLFQALEEFCKAIEIPRIELTASPQSAIFYTKIGFKIKTPHGVMVKELS